MAERVHFSLTASTAASVTVTSPGDELIPVPGPAGTNYGRTRRRFTRVTVVNHSSTFSVYYTDDGTTATLQGNDTYSLPPGGAWTHTVNEDSWTGSFISSGTPDVSVIGESS